MDALEILRQMHVDAKASFQKLEQASPDERGELWAKLRPELEAHEKMEEQYVYGPAVNDVGSRDPGIARHHQLHEQQVKQATRMIEEIGRLDSRDAGFLAMVRQLNQELAQHIQMEETEFWPEIRRSWGEDKLEQASDKVESAKKAATGGGGIGGALGSVGEAIKHAVT